MISKQEQQVKDILTDYACDTCIDCERDIVDNDIVAIEVKKIMDVFKMHKDTRSRRERALDDAFERMCVKPRVYHFLNMGGFKAVTVAQVPLRGQEGWSGYIHDYRSLMRDIQKYESITTNYPSMYLLRELRDMGIYGVAICDNSDVFNRRYGRNKAKGKLWQYLLKEQKK